MPAQPETDPTTIARRQFSLTRKGFDPDEVRAYLREVADLVDGLRRSETDLRARAQAAETRAAKIEDLDEHRLVELLGEQTARILDAGRVASNDIRRKAEEAAERLISEANEEAHRIRAQARGERAAQHAEMMAEVESLRGEAAAELDRRRAEGAEIVEGMRRGAQAEADELVDEAQVVRERILGDLARRRRAAREQLERLNAARERLLAAYDVVRRTVDDATGELSVALPEAKIASDNAARRVHEEPEPSVDELEDMVTMARIAGLLDQSSGPADEPAPVAVAEVVPEPEVLAPAEPEVEVDEVDDEPTPIVAEQADEVEEIDEPTPIVAEQVDEVEEIDEPDDEVVEPDVEAEVDDEQEFDDFDEDDIEDLDDVEDHDGDVDHDEDLDDAEDVDLDHDEDLDDAEDLDHDDADEDLDDVESELVEPPSTQVDALFARLRADAEASETPDDTGFEEQHGSVAVLSDEYDDEVDEDEGYDDEAEYEYVDEDDESAMAVAPVAGDDDLVQQRDEALASVEQELNRRLKRVLADEQNEVLDLLRRSKPATSDELLPALGEHAARYTEAARDELAAAASWGAAAVGGEPDGSCDALSVELAQTLVEPLRERIERSFVEAGGDLDEVNGRLRALYREWKGQRIATAVRHYSVAAYAQGAYGAMVEGTPLRWLVDRSSDPCPDADDNALAGAVCKGEAFPTGDHCPPAHLGCRCMVVPAE